MILTVTSNPTVDRDVFVRGFRLGETVRAEREAVVASGKGVGSSLVMHELGGDTLATGLNAGHAGRLLTHLLDQAGVKHDFVEALGETRTSCVLVDIDEGEQSTILPPSLSATPEHLAILQERIAQHAGGAWGVIFGGTLPAGMPPDSYSHLIRQARQLGLVALFDSSGSSLRGGVVERPDLLKINLQEALGLEWPGWSHQMTGGRGQTDIAEVVAMFSSHWQTWASQAFIVTLGRDGTVAFTSNGAFHAPAIPAPVVNTAGAGDAINGALMLGLSQGHEFRDALCWGMAAAASVVTTDGTAICQRDQVQDLLRQARILKLD